MSDLKRKGIPCVLNTRSREERNKEVNAFYDRNPELRWKVCGSATGKSYLVDMKIKVKEDECLQKTTASQS
jgi:hypothetical protein